MNSRNALRPRQVTSDRYQSCDRVRLNLPLEMFFNVGKASCSCLHVNDSFGVAVP